MNKLTKIIYVILFISLILHPHFIMTVIILHIETVRQLLNKELKISDRKLVDFFKYVGR